jgi:dipeptidyl aminopeptidase/acylaminoacyl peptidase
MGGGEVSMKRFAAVGLALLLSVLTVSGLSTVALAKVEQAPKRALTIEDYYKIKSIGDTSISPSGKWAAFTLSTRIEDDNTTSIETYVVPTDGSAAPRKIAHDGANVANPRWTDDGLLQYSLNARTQSAVFLGPGGEPRPQRNGIAATFKISIDTPNAAPVPAQAAPAGAISSDGKWIAQARDEPRAAESATYASDFEKRHADRFKGRQFDWMRFQQDGQDYPTQDPRTRPPAEIAITAIADGAPRAITRMGMRPANLAWHPNGSVIAFTADEGWRNEQAYEQPDIYTVTTDGKVTRLTNDGYVWSALAFSPGGEYLLSERTFGTGMIIEQKLGHGGSDDLILWPTSGGPSINLTEKWDLEPNVPRWSPDGKYVYFTAEKGGTVQLFRVAPRAGATVEQVTTGERRLNNITFDKAMTRMAYTVGTYDSPSEVWTANIDGSGEKQLTNMFADIRNEIAITKTTRLKWKSNDGTEIEGWLTEPYEYDKAKGPLAVSGVERYPLVVFNHGGPHSAVGYGFNFKQQYFAANGYFVLDTNFRSSTGYGDAFKWATWGAWGNKDGQDVVSGVDYVIKNYPVDASRVAAMGHSYGGFMTNWLISNYPTRFAAAASGAGIVNWLSDYGTADIYRTKETEFFGTPWEEAAIKRMIAQSPLTHAGQIKTPTLFINGEMDQRVPYEEAEQLYFAIRRQGVPAKMIQYAGQPHGISGHWNNVHRMLNELKWINTYTKSSTSNTTSSRRR